MYCQFRLPKVVKSKMTQDKLEKHSLGATTALRGTIDAGDYEQ